MKYILVSKERVLAELGKGTGREYAGGTDVCVCPECGYEELHSRGISCNQKTCPECDIPLTGKGAPGEIQ